MDTVLQHPYSQAILQWFESLELGSMDIVLIGSLLASWGALMLALLAVKRIKQQNSSTYKLCEKLTRELHVTSSSAIGMGQRIIAMERKIANGNTHSEVAKPALQAVPKQTTTAPKGFAELVNTAIKQSNTATPTNTATSTKVKSVKKYSADNPFDTAKQLLRRGVDQAEVARRCGLSLSETELMAMVINNREGQVSRLVG